MTFLGEFYEFMRVRKKFWLLPIMLMMVLFGGLVILTQGQRSRALHLHAVLAERANADPRHVGVLPRQCGGALVDGEVVAAAQEERFTRKKHDARFPRHAVDYCLAEGGLTLDQVDYVAFYDKPFLKFERLIETYLAFAPRGFTLLSHGAAAVAEGEAVPAKAAAHII